MQNSLASLRRIFERSNKGNQHRYDLSRHPEVPSSNGAPLRHRAVRPVQGNPARQAFLKLLRHSMK